MNKEIKTSSHKILQLDDGIVKLICFTRDETIEKARVALDLFQRISEGKKNPLLVDIRQQKSISREARQFYSGQEFTEQVTAHALVVELAISKVLANFFLGLNKPSYPTRLFTDEDEAIEWLKGYL